MSPDDFTMIVDQAIGHTVRQTSRVFFYLGGKVNESAGPFELVFHDGLVLSFSDVHTDSLRIDTKPWLDPFPEPMSSENAAFVKEHGKWAKSDVSDSGDYQGVTGCALVEANPLFEYFEHVSGVELLFDSGVQVLVRVVFDETIVTLDRPTPSERRLAGPEQANER